MPAGFFAPQSHCLRPCHHVIAIDENGKVILDLLDPDGTYPINTSVTETDRHLYIGSLVAPVLGRIGKGKIGL